MTLNAWDGDEPILVRRRSRRYVRWNRRRKILIVLVLLGVLTAFQIVFASANLHGLVDKLRASQAAASSGQLAAAQSYADAAHDQAQRARFGTWGPQFWLAEHLPWVGDNIRAAHAVSAGAAELSGPVIDAYVDLQTQLGPSRLKITAGGMDLSVFADAEAAAQRLSDEVRPTQDQAAKVPRGGLFGGLKGLWTNYSSFLGRFTRGIDVERRALQIAPTLLGAQRARTYLVVVLDNARLTPVGGVPVALMELTIDHGHLSLGDARSASGIVGDLAPTPDFSVLAPSIAKAWQEHGGRSVDGVVALDPYALAAIMRDTGSFRVGSYDVTAANTIAAISNTPYASLGSEADSFVVSVSHGIVGMLARGDGDSGLALRSLVDSARRGHAYVWLSRAEEEQALAGATSLGQLAPTSAAVPDVGVYFRSPDGGRMAYYVASNTTLQASACADGHQKLTVSTIIKSYVPQPVPNQPDLLGASPASGDVRIEVSAYGPLSGAYLSGVVNGASAGTAMRTDAGRPIVTRMVTVPRGAQVQVSFTFQSGQGQTADPVLRSTSTSTHDGAGTVSPSACS